MTSHLNKSVVFYRVFFALIMCRYLWWFYTTHETTIKHWHFDRKWQCAHKFLVFSRVFFARSKRRYLRYFRAYTKHRENTCTLAQNSVFLYKSLVFSRVFLSLIMYRYLPCSLAPRKITRKHLHFCQISLFFRIFKAIHDVLWVLMGGANVCIFTWLNATFL